MTGRPRRVVHVSMPTTEGVPTVLLGYARDQVERGWDVTVACPDRGWLAERARDAGARVLRWEAAREPGRGTLAEVRALARLLADVRPDVVHLHSAKAGLAGRLAVRGRTPTVYQPHGWSFHAATGLVARAAARWERFAGRWTDLLVCVSEDELAAGRAAGVDATACVVPNGVDLDRFRADGDPGGARAELGLASSPTAVCLGRLARQKGQDRLVEAWPAVRRAVPEATLVLVGDGPDRAVLERTAGEGVVLAGNQEDPARWLAAADVVVVASRWEGMALAPLEAMAVGRSVVGFSVTGLRESVPEGTGRLVAEGDTPALVAALAERLADPALAAAEGRAGRSHVTARHDAGLAAATVAEAYPGGSGR